MSQARAHASTVTLSLITASLACGVALKGWRVIVKERQPESFVVARVQAFMGDYGWQPLPIISYDQYTPITTLPFKKNGCPHSVTVSLIGETIEMLDYVRLIAKGDVAFIQDGQHRSAPDPIARQVLRGISGMKRLFGIESGSAMPVLAVSPVPKEALCSPPAAEEWSKLTN